MRRVYETDLERTVKDFAERNDFLYYHTHRSQHSVAGFPDCVFVRGNRTIYAELKVGKNNLTAPQYFWLLALIEAGNEVYVWWDTDEDWDEIVRVLA